MTVLASAEAVAAGEPSAHGWRSVVDRFEQVAADHPDRTALVYDGAALSYGALAARTAAVAAGLTDRGAGPEALVGLLLPRGVDLVVALMGTLRSGAAYLPLEPALPADRLAYMCDQAGPTILLSDAAHRRRLPPARARRILTVDTCARSASGRVRRVEIGPGQPAYAIYTSGSTGEPKAVQVTHGSLAALLAGLARVAGPAPARVGWNASASFDASVQQWLRLCRGDTLVLLGDAVRGDPQALAAVVAGERLDELDITPSHLVSLLANLPEERRGPRPLRLLVGGEAIPPGLWSRLADLRSAGRLDPINLYGPTECTVDATYTPIDDSGGPHLGGPLPGTRVYLLDAALQPVPEGVEGELYLAGSGVSRGYLGRPALTAQRFVPDVVAGDGGRMYRTGDRARVGPGGRLEFLGRLDHQVKLRGYRIELAEVEAVLSRCPGVAQAVAVVRDDMPGGRGLVGYCLPAGGLAGDGFDAEAVRRAAAGQLPEYMLPAVLVPLERLPLTGSGKVDRAALPAPARPAAADPDAVQPLTPAERTVAAVWCEVLGVERVGAEDNFFALGGQSVLAIGLAARLRRRVGRAIPLVAVFKHPVLRQFAAYLDEQGLDERAFDERALGEQGVGDRAAR
ncbi:MAG TPA: non-ribosomal peptide synthetase [Cryptosporangiaceae bacterium]|nr:non-ribosomal peptide synthetase [Cryptosporangiaceae bacterium]